MHAGSCRAKTRMGDRCRNYTIGDTGLCRMHGGTCGSGGDGRPIEHALYSKHVPADWQDDYEYFKSDPEYLSNKSEIAVAQTSFSRFLSKFEGVPLNAEMAEVIGQHVERITRLKEREAKRVYNERVVAELIAQQVQAEAAILQDVVNRYVSDTAAASRIVSEFASRVAESAAIKPSLPVA